MDWPTRDERAEIARKADAAMRAVQEFRDREQEAESGAPSPIEHVPPRNRHERRKAAALARRAAR